MKEFLRTPRLTLRELTLNDAPFIISLLNSPGWLKYIGDRKVRTEEDAAQYLENGPFKSYKQHGFGLGCVTLTETGTALGMCGLLKRDSLEQPDLGFAFLPEHNGRGYAHEVAAATLAYAHQRLGFHEIFAITLPENDRSKRLLEKMDFRMLKLITLPLTSEELILYAHKDE